MIDFRQTLPIIPHSTSTNKLNTCIKLSALWQHVHKLNLKTNIRIKLQNDASTDGFVKQLLDIGNGKIAIDESTQYITLPINFCKITVIIDLTKFSQI